ncbi:MAG: DUF1573 domain-containing protein [Flavobacteriales bacterium]|nr:DUF1573 domain-containing protein [Flavobacteriales bacterium]
MKFHFLLLFYLIISNSFSFAALQHHDIGLLCFDYTTYDGGLHYVNDQSVVYFPFTNCSGKDLEITIVKNTSAGKNVYNHSPIPYTGHTIKVPAGKRDSLRFQMHPLITSGEGMYDNSFSIKFKGIDGEQHLNIFCSIRYNEGSLDVVNDTIQLPTVDRGEKIPFTTQVYNSGRDTVSIRLDNAIRTENIEFLDQYPVKIAPRSYQTLHFQLKTEQLLKNYRRTFALKTNEKGRYPQIKISFQGELTNYGDPSIKFDSLVVTKYIPYGGDGTFTFWFENDGDAPLIISQVKSSCGCLVPYWPHEPIMPGGREKIVGKYLTTRVGPINKSLTVVANTAEPRIVLRIKGNVSQR